MSLHVPPPALTVPPRTWQGPWAGVGTTPSPSPTPGCVSRRGSELLSHWGRATVFPQDDVTPSRTLPGPCCFPVTVSLPWRGPHPVPRCVAGASDPSQPSGPPSRSPLSHVTSGLPWRLPCVLSFAEFSLAGVSRAFCDRLVLPPRKCPVSISHKRGIVFHSQGRRGRRVRVDQCVRLLPASLGLTNILTHLLGQVAASHRSGSLCLAHCVAVMACRGRRPAGVLRGSEGARALL